MGVRDRTIGSGKVVEAYEAELNLDMANYRLWIYSFATQIRGMTPAEQVFHDCNRGMRNTCVRRASMNCRLPEKDDYFYFRWSTGGCWIPILGPAVGVPPTGQPLSLQPPTFGGVWT